MTIRPLNSVAGFSVGEVPDNIILANGDITTYNASFSGNIYVSNGNAQWGVLTDHLYYSNGVPWDLQEAAGSNTQIQFNDNNDFGASANFTFDRVTNILSVIGNIDVTKSVTANFFYANANVVANNISANANINVSDTLLADTINANGTVTGDYFYANIDISAEGNLLSNYIAANANVTANNLVANANVTVTNTVLANYISANANVVGNNLYANTNIDAVANITGQNITANANIWAENITANTSFSATGNIQTTGNILGEYVLANANVIANNVQSNTNIEAVANITGDYLLANTNVEAVANVVGNVLIANAKIWTTNLTANGGVDVVGTVLASNLKANANVIANNFQANTDITANGNVYASNADLGNLLVANYGNFANDVITNNLTVNLNIEGNTANFSGNISALNANLGNLVEANYVNVAQNLNVTNTVTAGNIVDNSLTPYQIVYPDAGNKLVGTNDLKWITANGALFATSYESNGLITTTGNLEANYANFTGNVKALNGNLGNLVTANYANFANDVNVLGNVYAPNFIGDLANGSSNIKVYQNANVEISINGSANLMSFTTTGLYVDGEINSTEGNILSNGNVTANGFINAANANVTGEALLNSVRTGNIIGDGDGVTITADGSNTSIALVPNGTGTVTTNGFRITVIGAPVDPQDAVTKEYVDTIGGTGLIIHDPVKVESHTALNATYTQGGTTQTTTTITSNSIITFSANHGLSIGDGIVWDNSFNGIVGGESYWVHSVESLTSITIKPTYYGEIITTLTNGAGLSQTSRANPGVGATLTNAGANAAIAIDGITLSLSDRVLVHGQVNSAYDGIYVVTVVGNGATAWELTRSSDMNMYIPKSASGMCAGSYVFVQQGLTGAGESYVLTQPITEIIIGTDNLTFSLFSAAGAYTAGNGIAITGTIISANVDNISTAIVDGNIVVKSGANLVSPNLGNATFSSMTWDTVGNGNVSANNLSIDNVANITLDLTVGGLVQVNGNINSNANVNSNNSFISNFLDVGANIIGNNISANYLISATDSNISNLATAGNVTVTYELSGNTANFAGNVIVPNLTVNATLSGNYANFTNNVVTNNATVNLEFSGNTANFSGNVVVPNLTVNLEFQGNTANFSGNVAMDKWLYVANTANVGNLRTDNLLYANGQPWDLQQAAGSNTEIQFNLGDDFAASANLTFDPATNVLGVIGDANVSNAIVLGNTATTWGTLTTETTTPNQVIASIPINGFTGVQFMVKSNDTIGSKYGVATVQAVTDGSLVDYSTYGTVNLGGFTGALSVSIVAGELALQVTPASSNSTIWTTQYTVI